MNNKIYNVKSITMFFIAMLFTTLVYAQKTTKTIQLLDAQSTIPVIGATYQYGNQSGVSDENGAIQVEFIASKSLVLSHISYGQWSMSPDEVAKAMDSGFYKRHAQDLFVQPVTILALRSTTEGPETIDIDSHDRLAHDGGELLSQTPLIAGIRKSGNYGFDPVMRGFKYDQLNVVINGAQSATAACPNRMDPPTSQISPNMIREVEILKGPHSLRYGTAFGGSINFITTQPTYDAESQLYGRITGAYESNGNVARTEGNIGFRGEKYDVGLFGSYSQGDDYLDGEGNTVASGFTRGSLGALIGIQLAKNQRLTLSGTRNVARDVDFPALPMDLRNDDTWMLNANHTIDFKGGNLKSWNSTAYASFVDHIMDNGLKNLNPRMMNASTEAFTKNYGARTEGKWTFSQSNLFVGGDYKVEEAEGKRKREFLMGPMAGNIVYDNAWQDGIITKTGFFTEYHLGKGSMNYVVSGRLEINRSDVNDPSAEFVAVNPEYSTTQVNPNLSVGATKTFSNGFTSGIWVGHAQRSGSLTERFINYFPVGKDPYEMVGDPLINPEKNNQIDLSIGYQSGSTAVELSGFNSFLSDYIYSEIRADLAPKIPSSPGVRQFVNIDNAYMAGIEFTWNQLLFAGLQHNFAFAYTYGQNKVDDEPLAEIAPLDIRYTLMGNYLKGKLKPEIGIRYVTEQDRISTNFGETVTPTFTLIDIKVQYQILPALSATVGANNVFDQAYYEHLTRSVRGTSNAINAPGRNVFISLSLDLMK